MKNNFDLRKFLIENKLTSNNNTLKENTVSFSDIDEALDSLIAEVSGTMGKRDLAPHYAKAAKAAGFSDEQTKKAFGLVSRFMDKRAKGRRVKFINYGWAGYEDLYKNLVDILNKVDGGGWEVKNDGSWYGDGSGWQVVKTYPFDSVSDGGTNETAPGYMHDCAAKVMHEKYGNGDCIPEEHTLVKEGNKYVVTHYDVLFESGKTVKNIPVGELKIITESHHGHKRRKK